MTKKMDTTKVGALRPAEYNPRKISDKDFDELRRSMACFGDLSGIVVNVRTGNLIGGHQRVKVLDAEWPINRQPHTDDVGTVAIGTIDTPWGLWGYREVDWSLEQEQFANIAANQHGGVWDLHKLQDVVTNLDVDAFDFDLTGFDSEEIAKELQGISDEESHDEEDADERDQSDEPKVKRYELLVQCATSKQLKDLNKELSKRGLQCVIQ